MFLRPSLPNRALSGDFLAPNRTLSGDFLVPNRTLSGDFLVGVRSAWLSGCYIAELAARRAAAAVPRLLH